MKTQHSKKTGKIAVVGLSGVFPDALDTKQFIDNILAKKEAIAPVPDHRWAGPVQNFISVENTEDKAVSDKAGLIKDFNFNPNGYLIASDFLATLDPVHQLVLHAGREAFAQCSHTAQSLKRTGVILAAIALPTNASSRLSFKTLLSSTPCPISPVDFATAAVVSFPAAVLARAMGFEAGCFTLDAACASSLYSIKLACEHLHLKKADIMIAGGVSRPDSLYTQVGFTQLQALSPTGKCSPFDANANGLVVGEGTGIVVLKRLEDAIDAGDKIYAVISGSGASNDIEGTLVGPATEGQQRALLKAYHQASWTPEDIQYMECHGSGTPVGDQVELSTIKAVLDHYSCPDKILGIGSVKSNIGHLLTAAGSAGFIKTVLGMNKKILPPSLNFSAPAPGSIINESNIRVQQECEEWKPEGPGITRKAGISAFGFGGINAHLLIEEYKPEKSRHFVPAASTQKSDDQPELIPCAIVGMGTIVNNCENLDLFTNLIFGNASLEPGSPVSRWRNPEADFKNIPGFYLDEISIKLGEFHIPPNQMNDILPQHIVMLKAAREALENAGIKPRPAPDDPAREHMGCAIGIEFDYGATDFHLRWQLNELDQEIKDSVSPPLTFNRTLGALGGIAASRVAREFKFGGPCFTLSSGMNSGIKAIETGIHSLSSGETDIFLCGCVDLAGDLRQYLLNTSAGKASNTMLPSEGAAAIVLKPLDRALQDQDKIYGIISGIGSSSSNPVPGESAPHLAQLYKNSFQTALEASGSTPDEIGLFEACASGMETDDAMEASVINSLSGCISSVSSYIGNTFGASSLFSVIKSALCLYHGHLPVLSKHPNNMLNKIKNKPSPDTPTFWKPNSDTGLRKACAASVTFDGCCSHIVIQEHKHEQNKKLVLPATNETANDSSKEIIIKTNPRPIPGTILSALTNKIEPARMVKVGGSNRQGTVRTTIDPALVAEGSAATARAHNKFLDLSQENMSAYEKQFSSLTQLASQVISGSHEPSYSKVSESIQTDNRQPAPSEPENIFLNRDQCLEFAIGKAGNVLGTEFDIIDTYPVRVRLPDEPLMLVDRIIDIQGEALSLNSGKIITQHDVKEGAWYLDGNRAPVCISIEAGQADLFLCSWLGIDHVVKGKRKYRLLDASVTFHRGLPVPGETIEYHIQIDRFLKQGDVYLFFFHYKGYIADQLFISMRDGCAGFFTEEEVENSGGIILKKEDLDTIDSDSDFTPFVPMKKQAFSDDKISALRKGDLVTAFGPDFNNIRLGKNLALPSDRMHLIDRVLEFNPQGGRYGLGSITAQADIHPDDWFLTCHFIDDMVMPGTLMYECCAHALRIFTQRIGWVTEDDNAYYDVLTKNESELKCRGPVTPETKKARYEIEIKKIGYNPEPYVIADAHMFSDDLRIVLYKDMGMRLVGITRQDLESFWRNR